MLKKHYCPQILKLASIFEESLARQSYDLEDFHDQTFKSLMDLDLEKKKIKELGVGMKIRVEVASTSLLQF